MAFEGFGKTYHILTSTTSQTVQFDVSAPAMRFVNTGANAVFVYVTREAGTAVYPVAGDAQPGNIINGGETQVLAIGGKTFVNVVASSGTPDVYVRAGQERFV